MELKTSQGRAKLFCECGEGVFSLIFYPFPPVSRELQRRRKRRVSFSPHNWGKWGEIAGDASSSSLLPPKERARGCRGGKKLSKLEEGGKAGEGSGKKVGPPKKGEKGFEFSLLFQTERGIFFSACRKKNSWASPFPIRPSYSRPQMQNSFSLFLVFLILCPPQGPSSSRSGGGEKQDFLLVLTFEANECGRQHSREEDGGGHHPISLPLSSPLPLFAALSGKPRGVKNASPPPSLHLRWPFFLSPVDCLDGIPQFEASREALSLSSASKFISSIFHRLLTRTCMRCPPPCNNRQVRFAEMSRAESTEGKIEGFRGKTSWEPAGEGSGCGVAAATVAAGFVRKVDLRCSTRRRKKRR